MESLEDSDTSSVLSDSSSEREKKLVSLFKKVIKKRSKEAKNSEILERVNNIEKSIRDLFKKIEQLPLIIYNNYEEHLSDFARSIYGQYEIYESDQGNPAVGMMKAFQAVAQSRLPTGYTANNQFADHRLKANFETECIPREQQKTISTSFAHRSEATEKSVKRSTARKRKKKSTRKRKEHPTKNTSENSIKKTPKRKKQKKLTTNKKSAPSNPTESKLLKGVELVITVDVAFSDLVLVHHNLPWEKCGESLFILKGPTRFMEVHKLQPNDQLLAINGIEVTDRVEEVIHSIEDDCTMTFKCPRVLMLSRIATLKSKQIDPEKLNKEVDQLGGYDMVNENKMWQVVRKKLKLPFVTSSSNQIKKSYIAYFSGILI